MIFNVSGGGGTALNFRVVGGTTAPANPAENCIWVNTETPITSWIFSAEEPSPAEAGMVWFSVSTSSPVEFNALKKNGIQVYPLSAKQYVGGAWVAVEAKSYQSGEWVGWVKYLYKDGNQYEELTGGWQKAVEDGTGGSIAFGDEVVFSLNAGNSSYGSVVSASHKSAVDLSGYTTLSVDGARISGGTAKLSIELSTSPTKRTREAYTGEFVLSEETTVVSLDISSFNEKYYIHLVASGGGTNSSAVTCRAGNVRLA